jgi:hypothetical protein
MVACPLLRMSIGPSAVAIISSRVTVRNFEPAIGDEDDDDGESTKREFSFVSTSNVSETA